MKENKRTLNDAMAGMYPEKEAKNKEDDADLEKNFSNAKNSLAKKDYSEAAISGAKGVGSGFRGMGRRLSMIPGAALDEARVGAIKGIKKMVGREVSDTGYKKGGFVPPFAKKRGGDMGAKKSNPFMEMIAKKKEMAAGKKSEMPMKKMAKGGGIESKGKTKGTVIKMANGGSVSARADGIAQRGKTKTTIC